MAKYYNSNETGLSVGGFQIDSGYGPDEFCSIEPNEDDFDYEVGTDGEVSLNKNLDNTAIATVTLMQTSDGNAAMTALYQAKLLGNGATGVVPFVMIDTINGESIVSTEAVILRAPTAGFGKKAGTREWRLLLLDYKYAHLATG